MDLQVITAVRERVDIVALIQKTVPLTPKGRAFVGVCPFHRGDAPTLSVNREKGFFYCFGCKEKGTVFDFLMKAEGRSFAEAAHTLAQHAGLAPLG